VGDGVSELQELIASRLARDETLLHVAYGLSERSRAESIGRMLGAGLGNWLGGALLLDDGWAVSASSRRLVFIRLERSRRLWSLRPRLKLGELAFIDRGMLANAELVFSRARDGSIRLNGKLSGRPLGLRFGPIVGFADNVREAQAIWDYVEAARRTGRP